MRAKRHTRGALAVWGRGTISRSLSCRIFLVGTFFAFAFPDPFLVGAVAILRRSQRKGGQTHFRKTASEKSSIAAHCKAECQNTFETPRPSTFSSGRTHVSCSMVP